MQATQPDWSSILDFWLGADRHQRNWPESTTARQWFSGGRAVDAAIKERFEPGVQAATANELVHWEGHPASRLALVLLLDQFTRNLYRGQAAAFSGDHRAQTLVEEGLALGLESSLPWAGRMFFLMPLMHAEDERLQERSVRCFERLHEQAPADVAPKLETSLHYAHEHRDLIIRFGRFPHRNRALKRANTPEEATFLKDASRYGQ